MKKNEFVLNKIFDLIGKSNECTEELKNDIKNALSQFFRTEKNIFLLTDFYKQTHWMQTPRGLTEVYSYYENRSSDFPKQLFFGISFILQEYFEGEAVKQWMVDEAEEQTNIVGGFPYFNKKGAQRIIDVHSGRLPIEIKAVPEGTMVNTANVLFTIRNTDPELPFLTNFLESILMQVYSTIGTATLSYYIRKIGNKYAKITGTTIHPYFLNDFGFRGGSSVETGEKNGGAHLMVFDGGDNQSAQKWLTTFYGAPTFMRSVFATEHSTTTVWGLEHEADAVNNWLKTVPENAIASTVSDSRNWKRFITEVLGSPENKKLILERSGKVVARPDSGTPPLVALKSLELLASTFGFTVNDNGYKVLNPKVGLIYGDGINYNSINLILKTIVEAGWCVSNIIFGMGGALIQGINRDSNGVAIKCSSAVVDGVRRDVYKDPIDGGKKSKKGILKLYGEYDGSFKTISSAETQEFNFNSTPDALELIFRNGELLVKPTYEEIKERIEIYMNKDEDEFYGVEDSLK